MRDTAICLEPVDRTLDPMMFNGALITIYLFFSLIFFLSFESHDEFKVGCDWTRAAFNYNGQYVAVGSSDGGVFIFNVSTTKVEKNLKEHR